MCVCFCYKIHILLCEINTKNRYSVYSGTYRHIYIYIYNYKRVKNRRKKERERKGEEETRE